MTFENVPFFRFLLWFWHVNTASHSHGFLQQHHMEEIWLSSPDSVFHLPARLCVLKKYCMFATDVNYTEVWQGDVKIEMFFLYFQGFIHLLNLHCFYWKAFDLSVLNHTNCMEHARKHRSFLTRVQESRKHCNLNVIRFPKSFITSA